MGWGGVGWGVIAFDLLTATGEAVRSLNAVQRKDHFDLSPGFEAQNPVRIANSTKTFFFMVVST